MNPIKKIVQNVSIDEYNSVEVEKNYKLCWKDIIENPDGSINREQMKKELSDFALLIKLTQLVYADITGDETYSILNKPESVLNIYHRRLREKYDEGIKKGYQKCRLHVRTALKKIRWWDEPND